MLRNVTIGTRTKQARVAAELSQARLAALLGIDPKTVMRWEADRTTPAATQIEPLARELGVTVTWLLTGKDEAAA